MHVACLLACLTAVGAAAVQKDPEAQQANKLNQSKDANLDQSVVLGNCKRLTRLLRQKNVVVKKLAAAAVAVGLDQGLSEDEKQFQVGEKTLMVTLILELIIELIDCWSAFVPLHFKLAVYHFYYCKRA